MRLKSAVWSWLAAALFFCGLSVFAAFFDRFPGDERLAHALQGADVPALGGYFDFVNLLGNGWAYVGLTLALVLAFAYVRAGMEAVFVLAAFVPRFVNSVVKDWVDRPRPSPELVDVSDGASGFAFPSGHTVGTAALFGALFFVLPAVVPWRPVRWTLQAGCLLLVVSAGPARVYEGVHWPSDVFGGYLLALLFLAPALVAYRALRGATQPRDRRVAQGVID
jgi:undecaprenyl-diphosphatase